MEKAGLHAGSGNRPDPCAVKSISSHVAPKTFRRALAAVKIRNSRARAWMNSASRSFRDEFRQSRRKASPHDGHA